ncbi:MULTISPECIES: HEAT repeat domain-containing protein [unclassified Sphingopyxis]|uniref:HEAT repeat domain-containing protein n=1 Tax=unclassified Sphingopyxis TaxID=2614943 RepID=UPI0024AE6E69|nr:MULTISPECIES: HEAT repeat domain-containing protein [unclassified Sphingopyxis]
MTAQPSRHDHYPRADTARRTRLGAAAAGLEARWRAEDTLPGGLIAAIEAAAGASPDEAIAALAPWLADTGWLTDRLDTALALIAADPFARVPMRVVGGGEAAGGLILAERGAIRLTLQIQPAHFAAPTKALFIPGRSVVRILGDGGAGVRFHHVSLTPGEAAGAFIAAAASRCHSDPPRAVAAGEVWTLDTAQTAFTLSDAHLDVLLLELAVQPPSPLPVRSYDIASGTLVRTASARRDSSFRQMALTLLRHLGRRDAAPLFAAETRSEDFAARWSAMREFVALEPAAAHPHLADMAADDPHPEVRRAATATLALYPPAKADPCPA